MSNIAWAADQDATILPKLRDAGAEAIEVAPGRLFEHPTQVSNQQAIDIAGTFNDAGLPIVSMQALLFGQPDLQMFGNSEQTRIFQTYLGRIMALAGHLGCGPLVFGSPKNRLKGALDFDAARDLAIPILRAIGDMAQKSGVVFCLEANARDYGCDFITTLAMAASVAAGTDHSNVSVVADTGNMIMENEPEQALADIFNQVSHIHISAPKLAPVLTQEKFVTDVFGVLSNQRYDRIITLEMRIPDTDDPVADLLDNVRMLRRLIDQNN